MSSEKRDFDKTAASWDEAPGRVKLANDIAAAIRDEVVLAPHMDVLDFGCGTGLVTIPLAPLVRSVTGADGSQGMLDVLRAKIARHKVDNVRIQYLDLDKGYTLEGKYHLVFSSMTFHHVKDITSLLAQFSAVSIADGYLCIADLDPDEGRFHPDNEGVLHFGFERATLRAAITDAGFVDVRDRTAATVVRPLAEGGERAFSVFLMTARKRA